MPKESIEVLRNVKVEDLKDYGFFICHISGAVRTIKKAFGIEQMDTSSIEQVCAYRAVPAISQLRKLMHQKAKPGLSNSVERKQAATRSC